MALILLLNGARDGRISEVQSLLDSGINVNSRGWRSRTPLHLAILGKQEAVVDLLLDEGADINCVSDIELYTPLHGAAMRKRVPVINRLLQLGAAINTPNWCPWTADLFLPLMRSTNYGRNRPMTRMQREFNAQSPCGTSSQANCHLAGLAKVLAALDVAKAFGHC